ncbi:hypothetical protein [Prevotella koreensis]
MKQRQERTYVKPQTAVIVINQKEQLLGGSPVSGGHNPAPDDETLSAKGFNFFSDEEDNYTSETTEKRK